jgi:uncharacterized protein involved in high-affinity Fe2+ transport
VAPCDRGSGPRGLAVAADDHTDMEMELMAGRTYGVAARRLAPLAVLALLIAGCGSANKAAVATKNVAATNMSGMNMSSGSSMASGSGTASGMSMDAAVAKEEKAVSVDGITPIPTQTLAETTWQGMKIQAMAMTAVPFVVFNGTQEQEIKPTKKTSFHLMVMLNDAQTGVAIPYAEVWATIRQHGKLISDERTWPMISRYMGSHYGENVTVPGAGTYQLSLLVTPPLEGRHMEYANVWLKPHRVNFTFHWQPPTT